MASNSKGMLKSLKDEQQVRERPQVIFGTNDVYGCIHGVWELVANSVDEADEGYGNEIIVKVMLNNEVTVQDFGRGIPMDWNEVEQKYDWELAFCTLYASGKYNSDLYTQSLGLNGLGLAATQFSSEYMTAVSVYNEIEHTVNFKKGRPVGEMTVRKVPGEHSGTKIVYKPDSEVFQGLEDGLLDPTYFINYLRRQAMLIPGLTIRFFHEAFGKELVLKYDKGIYDFVDAIAERPMGKTVMFNGSDIGTDDPEKTPETYQVNMSLSFNFSRNASLIELYHNGSHLYEGGTTMDGFKNAITRAFTDHAKEIGKLSRSDKFVYKDIESILVCVGYTKAPGFRSFFKHQTKSALTNVFIGRAYGQFVYDNVRNWLKNEKVTGEKVLNEVALNKKAREEADKVSKKVVQSLSKSLGFGDKIDGFYDCSENNVIQNEIYFVEGKSALGSCVTARFSKFQAVMAGRGKIINCLKESLERILSSTIIINIFRVLGCGIEAKSKYINDLPPFDITKLKYSKIIICTDADLDGMQIRCLFIVMFYRLAPSLLKAGKVYIAETPLYEITYNKDTVFAYSEDEKNSIMEKLKAGNINMNKVRVQRSKGLGENTAEMMHASTMDPTRRRLIPVEYSEDIPLLADTFNALLGDDIETRKMLIDEYFEITDVDLD